MIGESIEIDKQCTCTPKISEYILQIELVLLFQNNNRHNYNASTFGKHLFLHKVKATFLQRERERERARARAREILHIPWSKGIKIF